MSESKKLFTVAHSADAAGQEDVYTVESVVEDMSVRTTLRREESSPPDSLLSLQNRKTLSSSAEVRREIKRQLYALFEALTGWSFLGVR